MAAHSLGLKLRFTPGLPDGIFSNQKNLNLSKVWRDLKWKMLVYLIAFWYICMVILFYDYPGYFLPVLVCCTKKNLATLVRTKDDFVNVRHK
jgi:uncharacterized membrane protein YiaA